MEGGIALILAYETSRANPEAARGLFTALRQVCRVVQLGQHLPLRIMGAAIPLVAKAIFCAVAAILARYRIPTALRGMGGGIALILAYETLRADPEAARGLFTALRQVRRVVQLGQHLPMRIVGAAIPLVAEAIFCAVAAILARY